MIIKGSLKEVNVIEGALYQVMGEDEMLYVFDCVVEATLLNGDTYYHNHTFRGVTVDPDGFNHPNRCAVDDAHTLADKVSKANAINTEHWIKGGNVADREDTYERLEREWSDISDHYED